MNGWNLAAALVAAGCLTFLGFLALVDHWIRNAEVGVDPAANLETWDDDEAAALLEAGA